MSRALIAVLIALALGVALVAAGLILDLPSPPEFSAGSKQGSPVTLHGTTFSAQIEMQTGLYTKHNRERRDDYLAAGGLVVAALLGSAAILSMGITKRKQAEPPDAPTSSERSA